MTAVRQHDPDLCTTDGGIAVSNLNAQIDGLTVHFKLAQSGRPTPGVVAAAETALVDLLLLRGQVLGRIVDYERAAELAEGLVRDVPDDGRAWLARARAHATFHRFSAALADLETARRHGADPTLLDAECASILQAIGCDLDALRLRRAAVVRRPDFTTLGALGVLQADRGAVTVAQQLFIKARRHYVGSSPFPVADLDFREGHMWLRHKRLGAARASFAAAVARVPQFAPALGHLAEVEASFGDYDAAIGRLRPVVQSSDDPEYMAGLAQVLIQDGQLLEAERWRDEAAAHYEDLVARHPEAFADHAAHFWRTVGGDRPRAFELAEQDGAHRRAARERALARLSSRAG